MKKLELNQMENIDGGGWFSNACTGIQFATAIYEAGAFLMIVTPFGAAAGAGLVVANVACLFA